MKYKVLVKEFLENLVEVEAISMPDAIRKVKDAYDAQKIVLGAEHHTATEFLPWADGGNK